MRNGIDTWRELEYMWGVSCLACVGGVWMFDIGPLHRHQTILHGLAFLHDEKALCQVASRSINH